MNENLTKNAVCSYVNVYLTRGCSTKKLRPWAFLNRFQWNKVHSVEKWMQLLWTIWEVQQNNGTSFIRSQSCQKFLPSYSCFPSKLNSGTEMVQSTRCPLTDCQISSNINVPIHGTAVSKTPCRKHCRLLTGHLLYGHSEAHISIKYCFSKIFYQAITTKIVRNQTLFIHLSWS